MIVVQNTIVSDDIADRCFCCDCSICHGACCVEGDSGAPLLESEVAVLQSILPEVEPLLTDAGRNAIKNQGVAVRDNDGDLGTPLVDGGACAYITYDENGCALCAIEKAFHAASRDSELRSLNFPKPVSCHLYPIRVEDYGEFTAVNYHQWDICRCARNHGSPLYVTLQESLVRRFGKEWYNELIEQINHSTDNE